MTYPIILCEDQITQLNQLETIIQNYILFHTELFNVEIKTQSPMEVIEYLKKFNRAFYNQVSQILLAN